MIVVSKTWYFQNLHNKIFIGEWGTNAKTFAIINSQGNFTKVFLVLFMYMYKT